MKTPSHLYPSELAVLRLLATGTPYPAICELLSINSTTLHTRAAGIRRKLGITNTRNPLECQRALSALPMKPAHPKLSLPTPAQMAALNLYASGASYSEIAEKLNIGTQVAMNAVSRGKRRANITKKGEARKEVAAWLENHLRAELEKI